jgi:NAD(P)-dependent dehydrogenase (short-subunit alcohol dehydrogenase family)
VSEIYGHVNILVNNAGINRTADFDKQTDKEWNEVIDVNLSGPFRCSQEVLPYIQDFGRIINISSIFGHVTRSQRVAYTTSKAALIGMTKTLATDYSARNVLVNAVGPGFIDTEHLAHLNEQKSKNMNIPVSEILDGIKKSIPSNRLGKPSEMGELATFLASDKASYITGTAIPIDGGFLRSY